jgi:hypothetical protein
MTRVPGLRNDLAIDFDGDPSPVVAQLFEELTEGKGSRQLPRFAVDRDMKHGWSWVAKRASSS